MSRAREVNSIATILTFENRDAQSEWSMVWSTSNIPGMDNAAGGNFRCRIGRRKLRVGSLALGALLTMHCRVTASALTGGFFLFLVFLVIAVVGLASPLRHFEVYLGQWSINGPGRAFRIVPLLDGIGVAMCLNAIFRAITCCSIAAMAMSYVLHAANDKILPFTYCRDFKLKGYDPIISDMTNLTLRATEFSMKPKEFEDERSTVGFIHRAWRTTLIATNKSSGKSEASKIPKISKIVELCNETYPKPYPAWYSTPAYNFFYVELIQLSQDYNLSIVNVNLMLLVIVIWIIIWMCLMIERLTHGRMVWNNTPLWFVYVPWIWTAVLGINALAHLSASNTMPDVFRINAKDIMAAITDAFEIALYTHSASVGTELITGKGLNRYASGHIDPLLNGENVLHSSSILVLTSLNSVSALLCAFVDSQQRSESADAVMHESTLWIFPMYSKCTSIGNYSHIVSTAVFFGLAFSYIVVAYVLLKTALHTIFEYRVKLVFIEKIVVGCLIVSCATFSIIFTTSGGLPLLESMEAIMSGVTTKLICLLELVAMLYVYRSHDFNSDLNLAMEDTACSSRISYQWQIIPFITIISLCMKIAVLVGVEMPENFLLMGSIPLFCVLLALPLRAIHNAYTYLRPGATNRNA